MIAMETSRDDRVASFIIALLHLKGIGPRSVVGFLNDYAKEIREAKVLDADFIASLTQSDGNAKPSVIRIVDKLSSTDSTWEEQSQHAYAILERASDSSIGVLHRFMDEYPKRMLRNSNYPPILYCKGNTEALNQDKSVAIIGTRNPTDFGARMGRRLAQILAEDGYVIVSGLASGCDSVGHEGALDAGGMTVAVLPTPLDKPVYPRKNQDLARRILENNGALISEYAPGIEVPDKQLAGNLVARDEWQPALSDGVIAIETSISGGTNHALKHAIKTSTPIAVFDYSSESSIPFRTDERFSGNVKYLSEGASPIFERETIESFKERMDSYRNSSSHLAQNQSSLPAQNQQLSLGLSS